MLPYDGDSEKVLVTADNEGVEYINIPSRINGRKPFWQMMDEVPEAAEAMDAIIAAIPAIRVWANTVPPDPPEPPPEPTPEPEPEPVDDLSQMLIQSMKTETNGRSILEVVHNKWT